MQKATSSPPSKPPITCPPIFFATTNSRSGTNSISVKFQTSFCSRTQAFSSSRPSQLRMVMTGALVAASMGSADRLFALGGLPQRLQFIQRRVVDGRAFFLELLLHPLKAALELAVGLL